MNGGAQILITGGAGFIGSRLAALLAPDHRVAVFDSFHPQAHDGNPGNRQRVEALSIPVYQGDVAEPGALCDAIADFRPEIVFHLAAETGTGQSFDLPARYCAVNVMGTAHLVEAIRAAGTVRRVVLAASRSVYGEGACVDGHGLAAPAVPRLPGDLAAGDFVPKDAAGRSLIPVATDASCPPAPASVYASTKLMQEHLLAQAFWGSDVSIAILRLQNVYGVGQSVNNPYTGVLSIFARQCLEGRVLEIYEDGGITRDFVHVDDVVRAFAAAGTADAVPARPVDIGSGEGATILELARRLLALSGRDPADLRITGAFRPGDIRYAVADIRAAGRALGWRPAVPLDRGLASLVEWTRTAATG